MRIQNFFVSFLSYGLIIGMGCSGGSSTQSTTETQNTIAESITVSAAMVEQTWVYLAADDGWRGAFEGDASWTAYFNRDYLGALDSITDINGARMHAEYAAVYRQATLMHAQAIENVYNTDKQDEDGNDTLYLRGVARVLLGNTAGAVEDFSTLANPDLLAKAEQWKIIANSGWSETSVLQAKIVVVPPVEKGQRFELETLPHFSIATTVENITSDVTDPTELWMRALWHENMAKLYAGENAFFVDVFLAPWSIPMEKNVFHARIQQVLDKKLDENTNILNNWLFLSRYLVKEDMMFLAELDTNDEPIAILNKWKEKSVLAFVLATCVENNQVSVEKVLNASGELEQKIIEMFQSKGETKPFYPLFADFAEQAVLNAGVILAEKTGQRRDAGKLRMNAKDMALQNTQDAIFLTEFSAWDLENRYTIRAQDMMHRYSRDFPAFAVVEYPVNMLQIRLGRSAGNPGAAN